MSRVFLYVRVSTEEQALHGLSIEAQTAALESWVKQNGHIIAGTYTDAGISARKPASKRPELQRLLADIQAGKGDLVAFTKLDRWFRNIAEYYKVQEILERYHVNWRTIHEDYDTSTASGRLKVNIMLSVAQDEADRTSERIKAMMDVKRKKQEPLTGNCPTGYKIDGKKIVKDPEKEAAVSAFFQKFLACGSVSLAQSASLEHGLRIEYQLASKMLDSPAYYGYYYKTDGMTPPYITKEEFNCIQSMRQRPVRKVTQNRVYLFSGIAICGECGFRLGGRTNVRNKTPMYNCPGHYVKRSGCENKTNLSERKIEAFLLDRVDHRLEEVKVDYETIMKNPARRQDYSQEMAAIRKKLSRLKDLYLNDLMTLEEYSADKRRMTERLRELESKSQPIPVPNFKELEKLLSAGWQADYEELTKEGRREFWRALLREIRIYPDRHIEFELNL